MAKSLQELSKNINFVLRLVECILCCVDFILSFLRGISDGLYNALQVYSIAHGWFLISFAYVWIIWKDKEEPTRGLQITLLVIWALQTLAATYSSFVLVAAGVVMIIDIVFLAIDEAKNK